jgi:hypothetical protein
MRVTPILLLLGLGLAGCSGAAETPPPPPTVGTGPATTTVPTTPTPPVVPPGQVMVTVSASSVPPGATVTGGGQMLGTTPFTTQVPVPAPVAGEAPQTFQFTFQLPGFQATTIAASPVNSTISLNAVLASLTPPTTIPTMPGTPPPTGGAGGSIVVRGPPGGPIFDYHTTTSVAVVSQACVIRSLRVDIDGSHTFNHDLLVGIRAPDGEAFSLQRHSGRSPFRTHSVRRARGHLAQGRWTLAIEDTVGADSGTLRGFTLNIDCM